MHFENGAMAILNLPVFKNVEPIHSGGNAENSTFTGEQQIEKRNGKFLNGFRGFPQIYQVFSWTPGGAVLMFKA